MLDISPLLLGITLIVFLILIAVLNSMLYKPLFAFMEKRDADIKNDLSLVGSNDSEIDAFNAEAEQIVNEAKLDAAALREKVISDAKELAMSKLDAKRAEIASEYAAFEKALDKEREELKATLASQVPQFKDAVTAKLSQI